MSDLTPEATHTRHAAELECPRTRGIRTLLARLKVEDRTTTAAALAQLARAGLLELPNPGSGATGERFSALAEIGAYDLSLARLAEGHTDALAILGELRHPAEHGTYGVWAADPPQARLRAEAVSGGYRLRGCKRYASGATSLTRALVTAHADDGLRLFDVVLAAHGVTTVHGSWQAVGMADSDSQDVRFDDVFVAAANVVGQPGDYLERPGFWHGSVGVAACWFGGALGCLRTLQHQFAETQCNDHAAAHAGAVAAACHAMQVVLASAAREIDADPNAGASNGQRRALLVRSFVERTCEEVLAHTNRALGSSALVFDSRHARRAADLPVYVRQHHAEADLAALGRLVVGSSACR
jgi:alkylation response protein AidB-like acyl-CoA dehydrogenase